MGIELEKLSGKIEDYFSKLSDEQLEIDLEKAGYEFYKNIHTRIFSDFTLKEEFSLSMKKITSSAIRVDKPIDFKELFVPDNYSFGFRAAA